MATLCSSPQRNSSIVPIATVALAMASRTGVRLMLARRLSKARQPKAEQVVPGFNSPLRPGPRGRRKQAAWAWPSIPTSLSTPLSPHHHLTVPTPCPVPWTSVHGGCARPPLIHITFAVADCQSREREDRKRSPKAKLWSIHLSIRPSPGLGSSHWARKG